MISQHFMVSICVIIQNKLRISYGVIGIVTSMLGALFGIWQCYLWFPHLKGLKDRRKPSSNPAIVFSLSLANSIACIGSTLMCVSVLVSPTGWWKAAFSIETLGTIIIQVICNFGYLMSITFTFLYLCDVCFQVYHKSSHDSINLFSCWFASLLLLVSIQFIRYYNGIHHICSYVEQTRILASMWLGILIVFLILDLVVLYFLDKQIQHDVYILRNTYSASQHNVVGRIRLKFLCIVIIFAVCWLPTIMSCIVYLSDEQYSWKTYLWFPEVFLNPMQCVLNFFIFTPQTKDSKQYRIHSESNQQIASLYNHETTSYASTLNQSLVTPFYPSISVPEATNLEESLFHFCPKSKTSNRNLPDSFISRESFSSSILTYESNWSCDDNHSIY